jgi:hypothetical protein
VASTRSLGGGAPQPGVLSINRTIPPADATLFAGQLPAANVFDAVLEPADLQGGQ